MAAARLSEAALARREQAATELGALEALADLVELVDPAGDRGRWEIAGLIAAMLSRFELGGAWSRIRRGHREPRGATERALSAVCRSALPRSRRRLFDLLT